MAFGDLTWSQFVGGKGETDIRSFVVKRRTGTEVLGNNLEWSEILRLEGHTDDIYVVYSNRWHLLRH